MLYYERAFYSMHFSTHFSSEYRLILRSMINMDNCIRRCNDEREQYKAYKAIRKLSPLVSGNAWTRVTGCCAIIDTRPK